MLSLQSFSIHWDFISGESHLLHHVVHLVCAHHTRTPVLFGHTLGDAFSGVICRLTLAFLKVGGVMVSKPHQMLRTCMHFTISTSVLKGQCDSNFTCVDVVFETRTNPHSHGVLRVSRAIPSPLPIFGEGCVFFDVILLVRKEPCRIQHLTNFQLNLDDMLVA